MYFVMKTCNFIRIKTKRTHCVLELSQSQWLKPYVDFNTQKRLEADKNEGKDEKTLYKLMSNGVYSKTTENVRN